MCRTQVQITRVLARGVPLLTYPTVGKTVEPNGNTEFFEVRFNFLARHKEHQRAPIGADVHDARGYGQRAGCDPLANQPRGIRTRWKLPTFMTDFANSPAL
jgi:hypothetical protein